MAKVDYYINPVDQAKELINRGYFYPFQYWVSINGLDDLNSKFPISSYSKSELKDIIPTVTDKVSNLLGDKIGFQAISCELPGLGVSDLNYSPLYNTPNKIVIGETRQPISITFRGDRNLREWMFFMHWHKYMVGYQKAKFLNEYAKDLRVVLFSKQPPKENIVKTFSANKTLSTISNIASKIAEFGPTGGLAGTLIDLFSGSNDKQLVKNINDTAQVNGVYKALKGGEHVESEDPFALIKLSNAYPAEVEAFTLKTDASMSEYVTFKVRFEYFKYEVRQIPLEVTGIIRS